MSCAAIKTKQQAAWSSGDYAVVGVTLQIVGDAMGRPLVEELERGSYDTSGVLAVGLGLDDVGPRGAEEGAGRGRDTLPTGEQARVVVGHPDVAAGDDGELTGFEQACEEARHVVDPHAGGARQQVDGLGIHLGDGIAPPVAHADKLDERVADDAEKGVVVFGTAAGFRHRYTPSPMMSSMNQRWSGRA